MAFTECNACARTFKIIVLLIAIMGLIFGNIGAFSCNFFSTGNSNVNGDIREALSIMGLTNLADVGQLQFGIFGYENIAGECVNYPDGTFSDMLGWNSMLQISQFCAAVSIGFGVFGILSTLMELLVCNFTGSFTLSMFSFTVAWATMAAAVGLFVTNYVGAGFCGENTAEEDNISITIDPSTCQLGGPAGGITVWSIICYFVASCALCCIPRPDAWMKKDNKEGNDATNDGDVEGGAIPVVTATTIDAKAVSDTPPGSETMTPAVTGVVSVSEPAIQVVGEVEEA